MTKKQFLHKCAGMEAADIIKAAKSVLSEANASAVINALNSAMDEAETDAGFYIKGFRTVFEGETIEAYGNNNCGCYTSIKL